MMQNLKKFMSKTVQVQPVSFNQIPKAFYNFPEYRTGGVQANSNRVIAIVVIPLCKQIQRFIKLFRSQISRIKYQNVRIERDFNRKKNIKKAINQMR